MQLLASTKAPKPDVLLLYRNRNYGQPGASMIGLGVNAWHTLQVLRGNGYTANAVGVWNEAQIVIPAGVTHCVIEAPWVSIERTLALCSANPSTLFFVRCHSQLAFLQVEPGAVNLMREVVLYGESMHNLALAMNSEPLRDFFAGVYHAGVAYLPNLYQVERPTTKPRATPYETLDCASWGAIRLQKNHIAGAGAALVLARKLGLNLNFHLMIDGGGSGAAEVVQAIGNLFTGLAWAKLVTHTWTSWPLFRRLVAEMDLAFHLSATETFSLSTADSVAEGVPVVVSPMIAWLPQSWQVANTDDPGAAALVGQRLLHDAQAPAKGLAALTATCAANLKAWKAILDG